MQDLSSAQSGHPYSQRLQSFAASAAVLALACLAYRHMPFEYHRKQFSMLYGVDGFRFTGADYLLWSALAYGACLAVYHALEPEDRPSKALSSLRAISNFLMHPDSRGRVSPLQEHRQALLVTMLKAFFAPMMAMSLLAFCNHAYVNGLVLLRSPEAMSGGLIQGPMFWFALQAIIFVDVMCFTAGYLIELPALGNRIRSVDSSPYGWAAALACYPPFNLITDWMLGSPVTDFPQFDDPQIHVAMNLLLLVSMATYTWASLSLGWKASNLTHRGIVVRGPYAFVRHPAYVCKNIAWWIGSLPVMTKAFAESWTVGSMAVASMVGWTAIYLLRALTEEDHLRKVDGDYGAYESRVTNRFIPGVI